MEVRGVVNGPEHAVIDRVLRLIESPASAAGFVLAGATCNDESGGTWGVEYRATPGGRVVILGLYEPIGSGTFTVELWSPDQLRGAPAPLDADAAALRRRTWATDAVAPGALAVEIAAEVKGWLTEPACVDGARGLG